MLLETQPEGCNIELEPSAPPVAAPPLPRLLDEGAFGTQSCTESLPMCAISCPLPFSIKDTLFFFFSISFLFYLFLFLFGKHSSSFIYAGQRMLPSSAPNTPPLLEGSNPFQVPKWPIAFCSANTLGGAGGSRLRCQPAGPLGDAEMLAYPFAMRYGHRHLGDPLV